jgi:hypothetical protein
VDDAGNMIISVEYQIALMVTLGGRIHRVIAAPVAASHDFMNLI